MRVTEFEKNIISMNAGIIIDKMFMNDDRSVRQVNAHNDKFIIVFDSHGRAFSASNQEKQSLFITKGDGHKSTAVSGIEMHRDKTFDLRFD